MQRRDLLGCVPVWAAAVHIGERGLDLVRDELPGWRVVFGRSSSSLVYRRGDEVFEGGRPLVPDELGRVGRACRVERVPVACADPLDLHDPGLDEPAQRAAYVGRATSDAALD